MGSEWLRELTTARSVSWEPFADVRCDATQSHNRTDVFKEKDPGIRTRHVRLPG